ncbi:DNA polymerase III subunit tau [Roseovarius albus]|uniref:DNA polymerase III subunit tau n=1 Tax=Roseovarius albus TaxID=1247867 RepID=A0A1X6ZAE6_9RHOB|nr:DNA polymerase III subunit delta' [Roseovarius albus]SLN45275.1 DNA polymerase III subunit tau [Roseovarius albus]
MSTDAQPEADRIDGAPHPRETVMLFGQDAAETTFLSAFNAGRLHHAWLLAGPRGVGKATLAWKIARFLLATPDSDDGGLFGEGLPDPATLDIDTEHPVARRLLAGSDPGLYRITRGLNEKTGKLRDAIVADNVRELNQFLQLSSVDGGRRVVIIDSADEMNTQAANALLKMLEEPPERTTFLLITHQAARLLPTIRSRCRVLRLATLETDVIGRALSQAGVDPGEDAAALAALSGGSVGEAIRLINQDGLKIYDELVQIIAGLPQRFDRQRAMQLAESITGKEAAQKLDLLLVLINLLLTRMAQTGAYGHPPAIPASEGEQEAFMRLAPDAIQGRRWADCAQEISSRARHGQSVNLDPVALVLDTVFSIQKTAAG